MRWSRDPSRLSANSIQVRIFLTFSVTAAVTLFVHRSLTLFDWLRSSITVPPIANAVLLRGRGPFAWIFKSHSNPAYLQFMTERKGQVFVDERVIIVPLQLVWWSQRARSQSTRNLQISWWQFGSKSSIFSNLWRFSQRHVEMVCFSFL